MRQEMMEFASVGPYANNLHLAPDRYSHHHPITHSNLEIVEEVVPL